MVAVLWRHRGVALGWKVMAVVEAVGAIITDLFMLYEWNLEGKIESAKEEMKKRRE
jgi:hypothetical protein